MNRSCAYLILLTTVLLASCGGANQKGPNPANMPVPVNTVIVNMERPLFYDKFPGTVAATMQVDLRPLVEGYITGIFFKEGDHIRKGEKLYAIDDSKYLAAFNASQANLKVAESNLDQAQKDADRYIYLNEHDAVAKQVLDHAMTTLQNAKNQVTAARQDMTRTRTDLDYSVIKAPFDGTIGISQVKLGNAVTPGQTLLNTVSTEDPMFVDFVVNEKQIPRFVRLQKSRSNAADSLYTLAMPDNSIYNFTGQVYTIDRGVNPQTGTMIIRLQFPNPTAALRAGMSCVVRVRNDDTTTQLLVPGKAIVEQMGEYFAYVAKDTLIPSAGSGGEKNENKTAWHALQRKVQLGQTVSDRVIIKSGLQAGDELIVDGVQKLHDGSLISKGGAGDKTKEKGQ